MSQTSAVRADDADLEYRAIEQTLLETARGRWFLAEHGRRARRLDSTLLEDAIGKLSSSLTQPPPVLGLMRNELEKLSAFVIETRQALTSKSRPAARAADEGAGAPVEPAPATRMLAMAEDIHELTWKLQADELSVEACEAIARHASKLYAVSRMQAMESERALLMVDALDDATNRLAILIDTLMHELQTYDTAGITPPPAEPESESG